MYRGIYYDHDKSAIVTEWGMALVPNITATEAFELMSGDNLGKKMDELRAAQPQA